MDSPQWYNNRLWNTSKQSIDGKPFKPPMRPQSASNTNHRPGFNIQPVAGNWTNFMRGQNMTLLNRDQGFTFRYTNPYRQTKSSANKLSGSFSSKYYNSLPANLNFSLRNTDYGSTTPLFYSRPKSSNSNDVLTSLNEQSKVLRPYTQGKYVPKSCVEENEHAFFSLPSKEEIVHGNINIVRSSRGDEEEEPSSERGLSQSYSDKVAPSQSPTAPDNTPRTLKFSSLMIEPKKSILKKPTADIVEPKVPTFTIYNNFYPSRVRTIDASSKTLMSPQTNNYSDMRKSLQSAPGTKREVRFDMSINNVIEYFPNN